MTDKIVCDNCNDTGMEYLCDGCYDSCKWSDKGTINHLKQEIKHFKASINIMKDDIKNISKMIMNLNKRLENYDDE